MEYVERMDPGGLVCRLDAGKHTVGQQKLCWADIVSKELKICKTDKDWREVAQIWGEWNSVLKTRVGEINVEREDLEKVRKNKFKQRIYSQRHR